MFTPFTLGNPFGNSSSRTHLTSSWSNVPANCTGVFQPADVGLNRVIKHFLRQENLQRFVNAYQAQVDSGITPDQVKFTTSLTELCDKSVHPLINMYEYFQTFEGSQIVKKSWEKCHVNDTLNLGHTFLDSRQARDLNRKYLLEHEDLQKEIEGRIGKGALGLDDHDADEEQAINRINTDASTDPTETDSPEDNIGLPLSAISQSALSISASIPTSTSHFTVDPHSVQDVDGDLHIGQETENIWAYRDEDGHSWHEVVRDGGSINKLPHDGKGKEKDEDNENSEFEDDHSEGSEYAE
jgi:hypothetical protein